MVRCFSKIQPVMIQQIHTLLRQSHSESNSVFLVPCNLGLIRRHKIVQVWIFDSRCSSGSFTASLDLNIDVFESFIIHQTLKITLHCRSHILIWTVEQCCVVFASTQCRSRFSKFGVVFNRLSGQMQLSFSFCFLEVCWADVEVFHFK